MREAGPAAGQAADEPLQSDAGVLYTNQDLSLKVCRTLQCSTSCCSE